MSLNSQELRVDKISSRNIENKFNLEESFQLPADINDKIIHKEEYLSIEMTSFCCAISI
jgi:hypothetical protein